MSLACCRTISQGLQIRICYVSTTAAAAQNKKTIASTIGESLQRISSFLRFLGRFGQPFLLRRMPLPDTVGSEVCQQGCCNANDVGLRSLCPCRMRPMWLVNTAGSREKKTGTGDVRCAEGSSYHVTQEI